MIGEFLAIRLNAGDDDTPVSALPHGEQTLELISLACVRWIAPAMLTISIPQK